MTKNELISKVAVEYPEISKKDINGIFDTLVDTVTDALSGDEKVVLAGLGTLVVKDRKARKGRNPQTGEEITIKAKRVVKFRACKELKEAVL